MLFCCGLGCISNGSAYPAASVEQAEVKPAAVREPEMTMAGVGESVKSSAAEVEMSSPSPSVSEGKGSNAVTAVHLVETYHLSYINVWW